jgi:hypothetical protein
MATGVPYPLAIYDPAAQSSSSSAAFGIVFPTGGDQAAEIAAALVANAGGELEFASGTYSVAGTGTIFTISTNFTRIKCRAGVVFSFTPTGTSTLFKASAGANIIYGFEFTGQPLITSPDTTFTKTALELSDTSGARVDIAVGPEGSWHSAGNTCIGILWKGRDLGHIESTRGIAADRPFVATDNPNSYIDMDLCKFGVSTKLLLIGNGNPNFEIGDLYLSNNEIDLSCNKGTDGLEFNGASNPTASTNNKVTVRFEQGTDPNGYCVNWAPAFSRNTELIQCTAGTPNRGYRIRNSNHVEFRHCEHNTTGVAADFTTCDMVDFTNCFLQAASTFVNTGMKRLWSNGQFASGPTPGAPFERWISEANANAMGAPLSLLDEFRHTFIGSLAGANASPVSVPGLNGNAVRGKFSITFGGAGDGAAEFLFTTTAMYPVGGAANLPANIVTTTPGANNVGVVFNSQGNIQIFNNYATAVNLTISVQYFF